MGFDEDTFHVQLIPLLHINVSHFLFVIVCVESSFKKNKPSEIWTWYLLGACIITCHIDHGCNDSLEPFKIRCQNMESSNFAIKGTWKCCELRVHDVQPN